MLLWEFNTDEDIVCLGANQMITVWFDTIAKTVTLGRNVSADEDCIREALVKEI